MDVRAETALAFLTIQVKEGIAIALNTDKTETTTTNSIKENPSIFSILPEFFLEKNNLKILFSISYYIKLSIIKHS